MTPVRIFFVYFICKIAPVFSEEPMIIPALGTPYRLGDYYDAAGKRIILGAGLWNRETLDSPIVTNAFKSSTEYLVGDDIDDKGNLFSLDVYLKASFMSGAVEVKGAANYLADFQQNDDWERVSLTYSATTRFSTLPPSALQPEGLDFPENVKRMKSREDVSHVVVGIEEGAKAVFVFERQIKSDIKRSSIGAMLDITIQAIPGLSVSGGGEFQINSSDTDTNSNLSCSFHGDFVLSDPPTNFQEARKLYASLRSLLGENYENAIPQRIYLYPLDSLEEALSVRVADPEKDVTKDVLLRLVHVGKEIKGLLRSCNSILGSEMAVSFPRMKENVSFFKNNLERFVSDFNALQSELLPKMYRQRRVYGNAPMRRLRRWLRRRQRTPFAKTSLSTWMGERLEEARLLTRLMSLPNLRSNEGDFSALLQTKGKSHFVSLNIRLGRRFDPFVQIMSEYLDSKGKNHTKKLYKGTPRHQRYWNPTHPIHSQIGAKGKDLLNWMKEEEKRAKAVGVASTIEFVVRETFLDAEIDEEPRATLEFFREGLLVDADLTIPSEPEIPFFQNATTENISITWQNSYRGADKTVEWEIDVLRRLDDVSNSTRRSGKCGRELCVVAQKLLAAPASLSDGARIAATIVNLEPDAVYFFRIGVRSIWGRTATGEEGGPFRTRPCQPDGVPGGKDHKCVQCGPGSFAMKGAKECFRCPLGSFFSKRGAKCSPCQSGTFRAEIGASECSPCPAGSFAEKKGASKCTLCKAGSFAPRLGMSKCQLCSPGTWNAYSGAKSCAVCPKNKSAGGAGSVEC